MESTLEASATIQQPAVEEHPTDDDRTELLAEELREAIRRKLAPAR